MSSSPTSKPPYLIRTAELPPSALGLRPHTIDSTNYRYSLSLGDSTGLTKTGVHLCRLPPGATSTTLHYHTHDDEWYYILDARDGAVLLLYEPLMDSAGTGEKEAPALKGTPREEEIKAGDFIGFKAGVKNARAHALRAGSTEVVYLVGGSRESMDSSVYALMGKRIVVDRSEGDVQTWAVEEKHIEPVEIKAPVVSSGEKGGQA
ncbi:hypothetical protein BN946_scf185002.g16 [Trametes cinnabarina]|uniref:Cupin 2 conserved barrel domain-containing protein n=1 Tax=Pycnoporus cinnabarinus TaxID=5643 RepID=A0A060SF74_PYCCI|nr:hypothetical protein BN946_scf185002.g16 [Trametes cinnabarina]